MKTLTITKENFETEVINTDKSVLLDFWAERCGPCRAVSPLIDQVAEEVTGAKVGKVNIDTQPELARIFKVMSIPMLAVVKDGKVIRTAVGVKPKAMILQMLNA